MLGWTRTCFGLVRQVSKFLRKLIFKKCWIFITSKMLKIKKVDIWLELYLSVSWLYTLANCLLEYQTSTNLFERRLATLANTSIKAPNGGITLICPLIEECGYVWRQHINKVCPTKILTFFLFKLSPFFVLFEEWLLL